MKTHRLPGAIDSVYSLCLLYLIVGALGCDQHGNAAISMWWEDESVSVTSQCHVTTETCSSSTTQLRHLE